MPVPHKTAPQHPSPAEWHEAVDTLDGMREVAAFFGIGLSTAYVWAKREEYVAFTAELRRQAFRKQAAAAERDLALALGTMRAIAGSADVDAHARLNAARALTTEHRAMAEHDKPADTADKPEPVDPASLRAKVRVALTKAREALQGDK